MKVTWFIPSVGVVNVKKQACKSWIHIVGKLKIESHIKGGGRSFYLESK